MKNLVEVVTNKVLNEMVDQAIRSALILQKNADVEKQAQSKNEKAGRGFNYTKAHVYEEGVRQLCEVLWRLFGGCTADSIKAIRKMFGENKSEIIGLDCQDYIGLFIDAFES